ncbi:hypothetical protein LC724_11820 [Blautia sp. RD014234]|nr:hypothetical protein [Blautia parvula]
MYETFAVFLKSCWVSAGNALAGLFILWDRSYRHLCRLGQHSHQGRDFYLILLVFSAGVMWKALSSEENRVDLRGVLMLPVPGSKAVRAFAAALAVYTVVTKTAFLLTVLLAVSGFEPWKLVNGLICAFQVCFCTAAGYWLLCKKISGSSSAGSGRRIPCFGSGKIQPDVSGACLYGRTGGAAWKS